MAIFPPRMMMVAIVWTLFAANNADARIEPSFHLEQATWDATHIVVLEPDRKREGAFRVVESWKGDLAPQSEAPDIKATLPGNQRSIYDNALGAARDREPKVVTENRRILFLIKKEDAKGGVSWVSAASAGAGDDVYNYLPVSTIWIEEGGAFAVQQWKNPGPARMHPLRVLLEKEPFQEDLDEARVKQEVDRLVVLQAKLQAAIDLEDADERAEALGPLLRETSWNVWHEGFPALSKCGRAAVSPLCALLKDDALLSRHVEITKVLTRLGGRDASVAMVEIVERELAFWKEHAPDLPASWRTGQGIAPNIADSVQKHHLRLGASLEFLAKHPTPSATKPVQELREYWLSLPQLDGQGKRHVSSLCDRVLTASKSSPHREREE